MPTTPSSPPGSRPRQRVFASLLATAAAWAAVTSATLRCHADSPASSTGPNGASTASEAIEPVDRPDILMLLVDDLKPALGCYGDPHAITPNIDRLASQSLQFNRAYCNQSVCAASRFTLMLGSHSTSTGLYDLGQQLRQRIPDAITLPQHFAAHGYRVEGLGKVFHIGHGNEGDPQSFPGFVYNDKVVEYLLPASTQGGQLTREEALFTNQRLDSIASLPRGAAWESPDVDDDAYADGRVARQAVKRLELAKSNPQATGQPFLIFCGFVRPHLPFAAPKKYWQLYSADDLPLPSVTNLPKDAPRVAGKRGGEIAAYDPVPPGPNTTFPIDLQRNLIHGYYASISYMDAQVGLILETLQRLGLHENTIVVLWSDHGYHLGDLGIWTKHTNYEQANRIPLLIRAPGTTTPGGTADQPAQTVDLYPTLTELAGLPTHSGPQPIDGLSLVPVLKDSSAMIRDHIYHVFPRAKLGRAIRTDRYRLVQWKHLVDPNQPVDWELYDYDTAPHETTNIADQRPDLVEQLHAILQQYPQPQRRLQN